MPKLNNLKSIEDGLLKPATPDQNYFLFMLGTDTAYTPLPTKDSAKPAERKYYENGETLSYTAQVVANRLEEKPEVSSNQSLAFSTPSVDLLNGPTTLGTEVGELIAQGIFLILKALAEGKTTIQIAGHSRGSVECILVAHELERIKIALKDDPSKTLFEILCSSPCPFTKLAIPKLFTDIKESREVRTALLTRLSTAKINMFLLDPVPGGSLRGLSGIAWRDDRFYKEIPCHSVEYYIARDERTRCFKPIVPTGVTPILMPGHHGTASGNIYCQEHKPIPNSIGRRDASSVQHLILGKCLNFFNKSTGLFERRGEPVTLRHPELDRTTNTFLTADQAGRSKQLLALYQTVHQNDEGLKHFRNTSYPFPLGIEQTTSRSRFVHYGARNSMGLDTIFPGLDGEFVNADHALLYLHEQMSFTLDNDEDGPDVLMTRFSLALNDMFAAYMIGSNPKIKALLDREDARRVTFQALAIFIDTLSQKYLRNHLSVEIKTSLLAELDKTFIVLNSFKKPSEAAPINKIITEFETILRLGIKNTAETHYRALKDQTNNLNKQLNYFLISNDDFALVFNNFLRSLDQKITGEGALPTLLRTVRAELGNISPITVSAVKAAINLQLTTLTDVPSGKDVIDLITKLVTDVDSGLDRYIGAELLDEAEFLAELDRLYDNVDSIINGKAHIHLLVGREPLDLDGEQLIQHKDRIVKLAAEILLKKKVDLRVKPESISSELFFSKVKAQAIALGAVNPELIDLQTQLRELSNQREKQAQLIEQLLTPKELACANFIEEQLISLTEDYFLHLTQEAQKLNPSFNKIESKDLSLFSGKEDDRDMYKKIITKYTATENLLLDLTDTKTIPLPSERIVKFTESLHNTNTQLKEHRDAAWVNYFKTSMIAIGVVCSGIIPGIIALLAYSMYKDKSPLFFTQSTGEQFVDKIDNSLLKANRFG